MSRPSSRASQSHTRSRSRSSSRHSSYSGASGHASAAGTPDPDDFCNAFWGETGYEALTAKVKASSRMLDDLRTWFKERAAAEEEYAKKLARLAKAPVLGAGTEVGGLKDALENIRSAQAQSAHSHAELAGTVKTALEAKMGEFINRRDGLRKNPQANIERLYKKRIDLSEAMEKSRKKYKADAIAVNGFTAQTHLVQGRDLDKVSTKLDKAQASVGYNEKEYRMYLKNMKDTTGEWNLQWKAFCDLAQDLEEDRSEFIRTLFWDYANGVSTICVVDDEQCETIRRSLESCETKKDVRTFVKQYGTGSEIYDTPEYINYAKGEQTPPQLKVTAANFARSSTRNPRSMIESTSVQDLTQAIRSGPPSPAAIAERQPSPAPPTAYQNRANTKRGGSIADTVAANTFKAQMSDAPRAPETAPPPRLQASPSQLTSPLAEPPRRASSPGEAMFNAIARPMIPPSVSAGAYVPPSYVPPAARAVSPNLAASTMPQPPAATTAPDSSLRTNRYSGIPFSPPASKADGDLNRNTSRGSMVGATVSKDKRASGVPQRDSPREQMTSLPAPAERPRSRAASPSPALQPPSIPAADGSVDPVVAALEQLRATPSMGSIRSPQQRAKSPAPPGSSQFQSPAAQRSSQVENRRTTANLQRPDAEPPRAASPGTGDRRHSGYAAPGEPYRRAASPQPPSTANMRPPSQAAHHAVNQNPVRQQSDDFVAGVPEDRIPSPGPSAGGYAPPTSTRPQAGQPYRQSIRPQSYAPQPSASTTSLHQPRAEEPQRAPSPVSSHGHGRYDSQELGNGSSAATAKSRGARLGQMMSPAVPPTAAPARQPSPAPQQPYGGGYQQPAPVPQQPPQQPPLQQPPPQQRPTSAVYQSPSMQHFQPPQQSQYGGYQQQAPPSSYQSPQQQPGYIPPSQSFNQGSYYQQPAVQQQYGQPPPHPQPPQGQAYGHGQQHQAPVNRYAAHAAPPRTDSTYSVTSPPPAQYYASPAPPPEPRHAAPTGPPDPPTGSFSSKGEPVLFYVRAMYAYKATIPEEFSFEEDDIIAVTQTNNDGWWLGELMDEQRRHLGGNIFPSNFVDLLK